MAMIGITGTPGNDASSHKRLASKSHGATSIVSATDQQMLQDMHMRAMLLEQQSKKKLLMAAKHTRVDDAKLQ
jgi:hypothetical protein